MNRIVARLQAVPASDGGMALVLALVFVLFFALVGTVVLTQIGANFGTTTVTTDQTQLQYGADAGLHWASQQVKKPPNNCGSIPNPTATPSAAATAPVNMPGIATVTVQCRPINGLLSNTFSNGYSVIAGAGYSPSTSCVSLDSDGQGGGVTTDAQGTQKCLTYKNSTAGGSSQWVAQDSGTTAQLNDVYALDATNQWAVGVNANGQETILYSDGEDWTEISTPTNTGGITNVILDGVYAQDPNNVWAVGNNGLVLYCNAACTDTNSTWTVQPVPSGTGNLNAISGFGNTLWAVGDVKNSQETIIYYNGTSWVDTTTADIPATKTTPAVPDNTAGIVNKNLLGVWATSVGGVTSVWAVGQSGTILNCIGACSSTSVTWTKPATAPTTANLDAATGISGTATVIASGDAATIVTTTNGSSWTKSTTTGTTKNLLGTAAINLGGTKLAWAAGQTSTLIAFDGSAWSAPQTPPPGAGTPDLLGASAVVDSSTGTDRPMVWAVGKSGAIFFYTPQFGTPNTLATISGGKVYNGNSTNFQSGVAVSNGNFEQYTGTDDCTATAPANLYMENGFKYCTTATAPTTIANSLSEPLPTAMPAAPTNPGGCTSYSVANGCLVKVTGDAACGSGYVVFPPGTYSTTPNVKQNGIHTYFFESGVYYFNNIKFSPLDDTNNNLWIIGGRPALPDDTPQIFTGSGAKPTPCYGQLTNSNYFKTGGSGFGVEWILGGQTWFDVHSVHLELFTRQGGAASEGAQGLSVREIPPACAAGVLKPCSAAWGTPSTPLQIFQVDQNNHQPSVFVHGGIFVPHGNIELYTNNKTGPSIVWTGPIDASSIELASQTAAGTVIIGAGGSSPTTFEITAISNGTNPSGGIPEQPFTEQAVITKPSSSASPWLVQSWRVCIAPGVSPGPAACQSPNQ